MDERQRLTIGILIVSAIQGKAPHEQVEILVQTIFHLLDADDRGHNRG